MDFFLRVKLRPDFTEAQLDYKQLQNADRQAKVQQRLTLFKSFAKQKPRKSYTYIVYTYSYFVLISEKRKKRFSQLPILHCDFLTVL